MLRTSLRRWQAAFRDDRLFKIAVFLIPFENFFFAPSRGWAAIAPILFFLYCLVHVRELGQSLRNLRRVLLFVGGLIALTSLNFFWSPPDPGLLFDSSRSLALGVTFLVALDLYFNVRGRPASPIIRILVAAYCISIAFGLLQLLVINAGLRDVREVLIALSKRTTLREPRVQFTFTEPAFISMHLYGVLLPLLVLFRGHRTAWRLRWVFFAFVTVAYLCRPSVRFLLDTMVVLSLWLLVEYSFRSKRTLAISALGLAVVGGFFALSYRTSPRVAAIVDKGVYADGSLAERWFLVNASAIGWAEHPLRTLGGWGLGNCRYPFRVGYEQAVEEYDSDNWGRIYRLREHDPNSMLCMPVRVVSEFGLIAALVILVLLYDRRRLFLFLLILYVYLPFDSLAFYTVWLYVFFVKIRSDIPARGSLEAM